MHSPASRRQCRGFTAVELLVVMAIIGVLSGLLIPAVQGARESAQRASCVNNLTQLSKAVLNHEHTYRRLPAGGWGWHWNGDPDRPNDRRQPGGWAYNILPMLGQQALHGVGAGLPAAQKRTAVARRLQTPVPLFNCPSRRRTDTYPNNWGPGFYYDSDAVTRVARSDYGANAGSQQAVEPRDVEIPTSLAQADNPGFGWMNTGGITGVIFQRSEITDSDITRGRSNVYLIGEKYLNRSAYFTGTDGADNENLYTGFNNDNHRSTLEPPLHDRANLASQVRFGSDHRDGFNMAFCDGSVRLFRFDIDPQVHRVAGSRR